MVSFSLIFATVSNIACVLFCIFILNTPFFGLGQVPKCQLLVIILLLSRQCENMEGLIKFR